MPAAMKPTFDLSALTHLRVKDAGVGNAWLISMPRMLWNHAGARKEREAIVDELTRAFPSRSLWLSDLATDAQPHWQSLGPAEPLYGACDLDNGGWALFFFPAGTPMPERALDGLAGDAASMALQLHQLSASAAITSLVDDDEWIVITAA